MAGIGSVPRFFVRDASSTRLHTCVHEAKASVQPVVSSFMPRLYTTAGTLLFPVLRFLRVVSSAHLDTCVHEAGVRTDPAASLPLPRVYTTTRSGVPRVRSPKVPHSPSVVCTRALVERQRIKSDMACPLCTRRQEQIEPS